MNISGDAETSIVRVDTPRSGNGQPSGFLVEKEGNSIGNEPDAGPVDAVAVNACLSGNQEEYQKRENMATGESGTRKTRGA